MKIRSIYIILFLQLLFSLKTVAQISTDQRTPEQEATKQTGILQSELELTPEQTKQVYQINLRYEKVRQSTSSRKAALEVIKQKNEEIQQVLTQQQKGRLENRRAIRPIGESAENRINGLSPQTQSKLRTTNNGSRAVRSNFIPNSRSSSRINNQNAYTTRQSQDNRRSSSAPVRTGSVRSADRGTTRSSSSGVRSTSSPTRSSSSTRSTSTTTSRSRSRE